MLNPRPRLPPARALPRLALACLALLALPAPAAAAPGIEIPAMPGARVNEIAARMRVGGTPTRIREFRVARPLGEVLEHYRAWFGRKRIEHDVMGWHVMARKDDQTLLTLRAQADGPAATIGTLSEADLDAGMAAQGRPLGIALPADSEVTSDLEMDDPGKRSRFLALGNKASPAANAAHFRTTLERRGYTLQHDLPADGRYRGRTLWFTDGPREALVVIVALDDHTAVTLNFVDADAGRH